MQDGITVLGWQLPLVGTVGQSLIGKSEYNLGKSNFESQMASVAAQGKAKLMLA